MLRFVSKTACFTFFISGLLLAGLVLFARSVQPPLPPLLYARDGRLYWTEAGCAALTENCDLAGRAVVDGLYSTGVSLWSPDGRWVAVHRSAGWTVYEADCLRQRTDCEGGLLGPDVNDSRLTWDAGSDGLYSIYASGTMLQRRPESCWTQPQAPCVYDGYFLDPALLLYQPHASPDGRWIAFSDVTGSALVLFETGCLNAGRNACAEPASQRFIITPKRPSSWPTFSRDGRSLLFYADTSGVGIGEQLFVLDVASERFEQITHRAGASLYPAWTDDTQVLAFSGFARATSPFLDLMLLDRRRGLSAVLVRAAGSNLTFPAWSPG